MAVTDFGSNIIKTVCVTGPYITWKSLQNLTRSFFSPTTFLSSKPNISTGEKKHHMQAFYRQPTSVKKMENSNFALPSSGFKPKTSNPSNQAPLPKSNEEARQLFRAELQSLDNYLRPVIARLTQMAEQCSKFAVTVVQAIEDHIRLVRNFSQSLLHCPPLPGSMLIFNFVRLQKTRNSPLFICWIVFAKITAGSTYHSSKTTLCVLSLKHIPQQIPQREVKWTRFWELGKPCLYLCLPCPLFLISKDTNPRKK